MSMGNVNVDKKAAMSKAKTGGTREEPTDARERAQRELDMATSAQRDAHHALERIKKELDEAGERDIDALEVQYRKARAIKNDAQRAVEAARAALVEANRAALGDELPALIEAADPVGVRARTTERARRMRDLDAQVKALQAESNADIAAQRAALAKATAIAQELGQPAPSIHPVPTEQLLWAGFALEENLDWGSLSKQLLMQIAPGESVLDIGTHPKAFVERLASEGPEVIVAELARRRSEHGAALEASRQRVEAKRAEINALIDEIEKRMRVPGAPLHSLQSEVHRLQLVLLSSTSRVEGQSSRSDQDCRGADKRSPSENLSKVVLRGSPPVIETGGEGCSIRSSWEASFLRGYWRSILRSSKRPRSRRAGSAGAGFTVETTHASPVAV